MKEKKEEKKEPSLCNLVKKGLIKMEDAATQVGMSKEMFQEKMGIVYKGGQV